MNVWHVTKLFIYEHLTCDEAVILMNVWHVTKLLYERLAYDKAQCYTDDMNAWHVTKVLHESLACDEAAVI